MMTRYEPHNDTLDKFLGVDWGALGGDKRTLTELRNNLAQAVSIQIDVARQSVIDATDTMGELVRTDVLENGRLVAARKIHADLERLTGELERLMTGRVEP
jgi:hypothetical protein